MSTLDQMMMHKMGTRVYFRIPHSKPPRRVFVHGVQGPDFKVGVEEYEESGPEKVGGWRRITSQVVGSEQQAWTTAEAVWSGEMKVAS